MKKLALHILALVTVQAFAQTTSWTGAADTTWHNASNWTSGVPTASVDVVIGDANYTGTNAPTIVTSASCRALTINSGRVLTVATSNDITVAGCLTNDGFISGDTLNVNFVGNATLNGAGTAVYDNFKVAAGATVTLNKSIEIAGDLMVNGSFNAAGNMITFSGNVPTVISGTNINLAKVTVNKTIGDITLSAPVTITDSLVLTKGIINTTGLNLLTLADNSVIDEGNSNSYVDGPVKKIGNDAFVFPLGNNGVWARLEISAPSTISDAFTAQYFNSPYSNTTTISTVSPVANVSQLEYWTCERAAGTSSVSVKLYWEDDNRSGISDFNDLTVAHWNGTEWENAGKTAVTAAMQGCITSAVMSSFSPFTFASSGGTNVLPITLTGFDAALNPEAVQVDLRWQTAVEINNAAFVVERSNDGWNFEQVASVKGSGNSTVERSYTASDLKPLEGISYYRLKQVDLNGKCSYSEIRTVEIKKTSMDIELYPNPVTGESFALSFQQSIGETIGIVIVNQFGQTVFAQTFSNEAGSALVPVTLSAKLPPGIYSVIAAGENRLYRTKFLSTPK